MKWSEEFGEKEPKRKKKNQENNALWKQEKRHFLEGIGKWSLVHLFINSQMFINFLFGI